MLQELLQKYLAEKNDNALTQNKLPVPDDLPGDYASWPPEWQSKFDERVAIMVAHWRDYSMEKIIQQADQWTRYYYQRSKNNDKN